jgi:hypothetical protein
MTISAIHKVTGTRIVLRPDQNLKEDYPEWDQLLCPVTGLPVFPVRAHTRLGGASAVRAHFRIQAAPGLETWPDDIEFDCEYGTTRKGIRLFRGESWEHLEGKAFVANQLQPLVGPSVTVAFEHLVGLPNGRRRIADVALIYPSGFVEVHEIQLASITVDEIEQRTDDYASAGIPAQWWIGKSNTDSHLIRDCLRQQQGGFFVLEFSEQLPDAVESIPEPTAGSLDF